MMKKSWRFRPAIQWVLLPVLIWTASAQTPASPGLDQQASAFVAMQSSLAQQQASIDNFRNGQQTASLAQQRQSVLKQIGPIAPIAPLTASSSAASIAPASIRQASTNESSKSDVAPVQSADAANTGFFTAPWPSSVPLSIPNVQVVDDSCEALDSAEVGKLVDAASKKHGVDPNLLLSVMRQESGFKPCATSVAGAMGLMQIMPDTADMLGLDDPYDAAKNVDAGAKFLKMMLDRYQGDLPMALGAYNAGPGTVDKAGGVPPIAETVQYISNVLGGLPLAY